MIVIIYIYDIVLIIFVFCILGVRERTIQTWQQKLRRCSMLRRFKALAPPSVLQAAPALAVGRHGARPNGDPRGG